VPYKAFSLCRKLLDAHLALFNRVPVFLRLYGFIYRFLKPKGIILAKVQDNLLYMDTRDDAIVPYLLTYGVYEEYETELFKKSIKPGMVVVDIGANIGYYSLIAARLVGISGKVYAFEPETNNYNILISNIKINNFTNIIIPIQKAVLDKCGKTNLFIDKYNLGLHSISKNNITTKSSGFIEAETTTIDSFLRNMQSKRVDLIKIDVEGSEGFIIRGAEETLKHNNPKIIMEFSPRTLKNAGSEAIDLLLDLKRHNFKIKVILHRQMLDLANLDEIIEIAEKEVQVNLFLEK